MAGAHGLQHFQDFTAAHFAHDDAVGPHAQAVAQQFPNRDDARALEAARPAFQTHHVRVIERQLCRVFNGDHALGRRNVIRHCVEQRRLAGAGATAYQDVAARAHSRIDQRPDLFAHRAQAKQVFRLERIFPELADRHDRPFQRQRRNHHVDAAAVRQARIDHRVGFVQPPADGRKDAAHDAQQVVVVGKAHRNALQNAVARHVHVQVAVDENVFHRRIGQQVFDGPEASQLLGQRLGNLPDLRLVDGNAAHPRKAFHFQIDKTLDGRARPAAELGAKFFDACQQVFVGGFLDVLESLRNGKRAVAGVRLVGELDGLCHVAFRSVVPISSSLASADLRLERPPKRPPSRALTPDTQFDKPDARSLCWA